MNDKFDELAKGLAQSVTRRSALKKCSLGFAGIVLASLGLANKAEAHPKPCKCHQQPYHGCPPQDWTCINSCTICCGEGKC